MTVYLDASSLVKLYVKEAGSDRGFDAIHLASFEPVLERAGDEDNVMFSTADHTLARAARRLR
jgi:hypothetical protein